MNKKDRKIHYFVKCENARGQFYAWWEGFVELVGLIE